MRFRWGVHLARIVATLALASCDDAKPPVPAAAGDVPAGQATRRLSLSSIPFTVAVPDGWDVRAGPGGRLTLNGRTPDGTEVDVFFVAREPIAAESLPATLARLAPTTARSTAIADAGGFTRRVDGRDGLTVVEETERVGSEFQPADLAAYRWTIQYLVIGDGLSVPVYELKVSNLTQVLYERNHQFLRAIFDTVQYDGPR